MAKLVICRGLPASGKSTWAKQKVKEYPENWVRVNRDLLRMMVYGGEFVPGITEGRIIKARDAIIHSYLKAGLNTIVDDTNLRAKTVKDLLKIARSHNAEVAFKDFDVPVDECIMRDMNRKEGQVGSKVIRDFHQKYLNKGFPAIPVLEESEFGDIVPYVPNENLSPAVIFDIDGTVALHNGRDPYDETKVHLDSVNENVWAMMHILTSLGYKIIFLSGRHDSCREATEQWLKSNAINPMLVMSDSSKLVRDVLIKYENVWAPWWELHMRKEGDNRPDYKVKLDLFNEHVRSRYNVLGVFDDRDQVVALWRELGLTCYQVNYGDF